MEKSTENLVYEVAHLFPLARGRNVQSLPKRENEFFIVEFFQILNFFSVPVSFVLFSHVSTSLCAEASQQEILLFAILVNRNRLVKSADSSIVEGVIDL